MSQLILITGDSSGSNRLTAEALACGGHTVHASMRDIDGRNAPEVRKLATFADDNGIDLPLNLTCVGDARVATSAAETFVLELVATVGRRAHHGGRNR